MKKQNVKNKMQIAIDFTTNLDKFAEQVLRTLYNVDKFKVLFRAGVVVNTGLSDEGWIESCLGFEQYKEHVDKVNNITKLECVFCIEGIFYYGMSESDYSIFKNSDIQNMAYSSDAYLINGEVYHYSLHDWSDTFEYYSDGTLKHPVIDDLECLVDIYYPQYTIVRKINVNVKKYALLIR